MSNCNCVDDEECEKCKEFTEAEWAAYRTAASQVAKAVRAPLLAAMKREGLATKQTDMIREFIDTPRGLALLSLVLGYAINLMPDMARNANASQISRQLRIGGMHQLFEEVADVFTGPLRKALAGPLRQLGEA